MIESPRLHRTVDTLQHDMVDTTGRDKLVVLLETLQVRPGARTLLFCNTVSSCRAVEHYLSEQRFPSLSYHGELNSAERRENIATFKAGDVAVLVCTDLAARGLDMPVVSHVIMFDFPLNPIDYLHRAGRTARMGSDGLVTALVAKRDRVLATAIDRAIGKGLPLDSLTSNKADYVAGKGRLANVVSVNARPSARSSTNRHARSSSAPSRASTRARNLHDRWAAQESLQEKKKARLAERRRTSALMLSWRAGGVGRRRRRPGFLGGFGATASTRGSFSRYCSSSRWSGTGGQATPDAVLLFALDLGPFLRLVAGSLSEQPDAVFGRR